jgi:heparan-alpha-glucosaminide N-acetyltransferase
MNTPVLAPASAVSSSTPVAPERPARLFSVDVYRGFVMFLMMAEVLELRKVAAALPDSGLWRFLAWHQTHVEWVGASLHDLIQPSFSFLVGVALPYSIASRQARGESPRRMAWHAALRALLLILLGVFLRSTSRSMTYWTFEDTLSQIGLGYFFLFLLGFRSLRAQGLAFVGILAGYWAAFALHPLPGPGFDFAAVGVPADWLAAHGLSGFAAHWQKNADFARAFDVWWLNLFPRESPFVFNKGGYATLSFIPTLATMILGLWAGQFLRSARPPADKVRWFVIAGLVGLAAGAVLGLTGICPVVKRIWTPSWVLFSGGWCFLLLAGFHFVTEIRGWRAWAFPLVVIGANSIAAYVIAHLFEAFIAKQLVTHLGSSPFHVFGPAFEPLLRGAGVLLVMWLLLLWMYRRKLFLKI